ncbi:MAG TPA: sigma-70 family RNA polymerase sigma factor [Opitutaceae bacterium]|nr:sigma-70 family RNA polymerase sigma factor [Opitutaceae bacterium]
MALSISPPRAPSPLALRAVSAEPRRSEPATARESSPEGLARRHASRAEAVVDGALVQRFNAGDETAFTEIVARHRERILALAERFLRNHADAEEIAQDTFIRAHRGLARFRGDASLATWLHRIAFNLARNRYWYFYRRRRHLTCSLDAPLGADTTATFGDVVATTEADPARQATVDEFSVLVTTCMEKLCAGHREILTQRNLFHRSYDQIAHALGTNDGTVKSRIARARGKLRRLMLAACPEFSADAAAAEWFESACHPARAA